MSLLTVAAIAVGLFSPAFALPGLQSKAPNSSTPVVNQTTCAGVTYTYQKLAGYGFVPGNARDSAGDTIGT